MLLNAFAFSVRLLDEEMLGQLVMALFVIFTGPTNLMSGEVSVIFAPVLFAVRDILAFEAATAKLILLEVDARFKSPPVMFRIVSV
jgi:hypothetical protein